MIEGWNLCHDASYRVEAADLGWHLGKQDWIEYETQTLEGVHCLLARASAEGARRGIPAENLWLSLMTNVESPEVFFPALVQFAQKRGVKKMLLGGEEFHWISGLPQKDAAVFQPTLEKLGFQFSDVVDYGGTISSSNISGYIKESHRPSWEDWSLAKLEEEDALDELGSFLLKEFPGRWTREFHFWRERSDTKCANWFSLKNKNEMCLRGFARLSLRGKKSGEWFPAALRMPFSTGKSEFDSCLGPIGMAAAERGKGNGRVLLAKSLEYLLSQNAQTLCIDWTNAYNYYIPLGLPVLRKYRSAWKVF